MFAFDIFAASDSPLCKCPQERIVGDMPNQSTDSGFIEKLAWIEKSWRVALDEVIQPYIDLNREPSDTVLEALGSILGRSHNEVRVYIGRKAKEQGSTLLRQWVSQA